MNQIITRSHGHNKYENTSTVLHTGAHQNSSTESSSSQYYMMKDINKNSNKIQGISKDYFSLPKQLCTAQHWHKAHIILHMFTNRRYQTQLEWCNLPFVFISLSSSRSWWCERRKRVLAFLILGLILTDVHVPKEGLVWHRSVSGDILRKPHIRDGLNRA